MYAGILEETKNRKKKKESDNLEERNIIGWKRCRVKKSKGSKEAPKKPEKG